MPTIFTISMVDMLCCSLGCVILLWLIKTDKLKKEEAHNNDAAKLLVKAKDDLDAARTLLTVRDADLDAIKKLLAARDADLEAARKNLVLVDADVATLRIKLKDSAAQGDDVSRQLMSAQVMLQLLAQLVDETSADAEARKLKLGELEKLLTAFKDKNKDLERRLELSSINFDELQKKLAAADLKVKQLALLADQVPDLKSDLQKMRDRAAGQETLAETLKKQLDQRGRDLAAADLRLKDLGVVADRVPGLESDLKKARERGDTQTTLADSFKRQLDERGRDLALMEKKVEALQLEKSGVERSLTSALTYRERLATAEDALKKLQKDYDARMQDLARAEGDVASLTRERATLQKDNEGLAKDRDTWRRESDRLQREADNRFAGINLTGSRIVFLVDMSGSMDYVDDETRSPTKWKKVCETVRKIMKTLPKPEKYQVIAFSDKVIFPLGNESKWIDFDPAASPDKAFSTLQSIQPRGGTNMHLGLEAAFRYRNDGLDAIYFLSDGLPNRGPDVTDDQLHKLSETELGVILSKAIRKKLLTDWNRTQPSKARVAVNTIGFFYESPDVGAFLWALSRENGGSFVGMSEP
jgi:predicted  nucleic acid-binding Zn-ribbon protein